MVYKINIILRILKLILENDKKVKKINQSYHENEK